MNYENFIHQHHQITRNPLDVLLCSGNGFMSKRIQRYNYLLGVRGAATQISHVGLIGPNSDEVFEATTLNAWAGLYCSCVHEQV